jgi:putative transposase
MPAKSWIGCGPAGNSIPAESQECADHCVFDCASWPAVECVTVIVAQRLPNGRWIRVLTVVDQFTRECLTLHADTALSGEKVAMALSKIVGIRGAPQSITVDNGTEFSSKAMDLWAYSNGVHFIRPGRPVENSYIESFNGRLRDECLNMEVFFTLADARHKLALWRHDYNHHRPHSALADRTPAEFAAILRVEKTAMKPPWKTLRVSHFPTARLRLA